MAGPNAERRNRAHYVALVIVSILLCLAAAEVVLRYVPPDLESLQTLVMPTEDTRPYVLRPNARAEFKGFFRTFPQSINWKVNAQGLREDRLVPPRAGKFRIATYGDSETFGWSVASQDTFQKQMQAIDDRIEVINFGIPGYNAANIADHLERTLPQFQPDLVLYLAHNNDLDRSLEISEILMHSHLLMRLRFLYERSIVKPRLRKERRSTPPKGFFAREVDRIIRFSERHGVPIMLAFLKWKTREALHTNASPDHWIALHSDASRRDGADRLYEVDLQSVVKGVPRVDDHLSKTAHKKIATHLCQAISGTPGSTCVPAGWSRRQAN